MIPKHPTTQAHTTKAAAEVRELIASLHKLESVLKADNLDLTALSAAKDDIKAKHSGLALSLRQTYDSACRSLKLENYLTTPIFTTREIGTSKNIKGVKGGWNDTLWWANGNGLQTGGDMSRRVLRIDIEDKTGRPESRRPEVSDLEGYCHANRAELLSHALTLLSDAGSVVHLPVVEIDPAALLPTQEIIDAGNLARSPQSGGLDAARAG